MVTYLAGISIVDEVPPSVISDHNLLTDLTVGQLIAVGVTIAILVGFFRKVNPVMHRLNDMIDDWNGRAARPGKDREPGVMERMKDTDKVLQGHTETLEDQNVTLSHLRKKVEPIVDDTAAGNHAEVLKRLDTMAEHSEACGEHLVHIEKLLHRHIRESRAWVSAVDKAAADRNFEMPQWPELPDKD
jgi:hypothetical protein